MKVLIICNVFPSVSETFVLNQVTGLIDRGHEVDVYAARGDWSILHPGIEQYQLRERVYYRRQMPVSKWIRFGVAACLVACQGWKAPVAIVKALNPIRYGKRALNLSLLYLALSPLPRRDYDVIFCHFGPNGLIGNTLRSIGAARGRLVTVFHGFDMTRVIQQFGGEYYETLFTNGDLLLPISERWKRRLVELGAEPGKTKVHHMGVNTKRITYIERNRSKTEPVRLLSIARLVEKKGIEYAIRAVAKLAGRGVSVDYAVAGEGPLRGELENLVDQLGVREHVRLLGWLNQSEVAKLVNDAHVLLSPSVTARDGDQEGIPVALMEALARGLPVISTHHSGIPELVQDGVSGYLVPERDVDALAERLGDLIEHPERWPEMGRAGRRHVEEHYDINKLNDRLVGIYQDLVNNPGSRVDPREKAPFGAVNARP